ncbi:MAG: DHH family phosphoesterase [Christensenellales bacterium]
MLTRTLDKIALELKQAETIAIISHTNPDPDTVCAALSLYHALSYFDKKAHLYCDTPIKGKLKTIKGTELFNKFYSPSYYVCVCIDCSDIKRIGDDIDVFYSSKITINIDHHKTNTEYAQLNYIESYASSACEILYKLILRLSPDALNDTIAALLYTGIVADSGAFTFPSTTNDTMIIAGELMRFNFNASDICYEMIKKIKKSVFNLKMRALNGLVTYDKNTIGLIKFTLKDFKSTKTSIEDTSGIINDVINIETVRIAIAVSETQEGVYKVSMRSKGHIDVARVAEIFGGGGHLNASGLELSGDFESIITRLIRECRRALRE